MKKIKAIPKMDAASYLHDKNFSVFWEWNNFDELRPTDTLLVWSDSSSEQRILPDNSDQKTNNANYQVKKIPHWMLSFNSSE